MLSDIKKQLKYKNCLHREHHQKWLKWNCSLLDNLADVLGSFALTLKQGRKACQWIALLPVSKAHTNKFYIFGQCMYTPGKKYCNTLIFFSWQHCATQVICYWQKFTQNSTGMLQIESLAHRKTHFTFKNRNLMLYSS